MQFKPKTQAEIDAEGLIEEGVYPFRVLEATEKTDKNGVGFFNVKLNVFASEKGNWVFDNLSPDWMAFKLRNFCEQTGLLDKYEAGELEAYDIEGREGYVRVFRKAAAKGYSAKNEVEDYVDREEDSAPIKSEQQPPKRTAAPSKRAPADPDLDAEMDQDIPF